MLTFGVDGARFKITVKSMHHLTEPSSTADVVTGLFHTILTSLAMVIKSS